MNRRTMTSGIALFLAALLLALAPVAWALPSVLEQAKKDGVIGEQAAPARSTHSARTPFVLIG